MDGPRLLNPRDAALGGEAQVPSTSAVEKPGPGAYARRRCTRVLGPCMSGEERKVLQVRAMCQVARGCAEVVATHDPDDRLYEYEKETYRKRKLRAIQITNSIQDRFYFETALHSIIDLCIAANELDDARRLFRTITVDVIRDQLLKSHPPLGRLS
jgi:hypothetical protein